MKTKNFIFALLSVVVASLGCRYFNSMGLNDWYATIEKPSITPPNYVFPVVWNILYILLATSFYKILASKKNKKRAISLYLWQLTLQVVWCAVFFGNQQIKLGVIVLIVINYFAIKMLKEFKNLDKSTFYMILPYNIWLLFALILNASYLIL